MKEIFENWRNNLREEINEFPYQIYCDMDGVLVDLITGILDHVQLSVEDTSMRDTVTELIKTQWSWKKPHPNPKYQQGLEHLHMLLGDNVKLWAELPGMPDKSELWGYISQYDPNILSHPWDEASSTGKEAWLRQNLDPQPKLVFLSGDKFKWATTKDGRPNLLIDDFEKYTVPWEKAGGVAILHTSAENTIRQLERIKREK